MCFMLYDILYIYMRLCTETYYPVFGVSLGKVSKAAIIHLQHEMMMVFDLHWQM